MKTFRQPLALLLLAALAGCTITVHDESGSTSRDIEYIAAPGSENADLPYSAAVRAGNTLYLSGTLGFDRHTGELVPGGIKPETSKALQNIERTLESYGLSMDRVVKCTVFLADINEWAEMNEVYTTFFPSKPARSALGASGLGLGARVEIECIAIVD